MPSEPEIKSALIVVDMQCARLTGPGRPHDADVVIHRVCALVDQARREDVQIVFVRHISEHCPYGANGWKLISALEPRFPDWVIDRQDANIFHGTNLAAQLKAFGISRLIMAGAHIETSCQAAPDLGFDVVLAEDAYTTPDSEGVSAAPVMEHDKTTVSGPFTRVATTDSLGFERQETLAATAY